ncbi:MAG TPA: phage major capsid protein [Vicinamibacterales bacterium]|nr:phage major capsid protein [Vicinamibacterales bacterium]
MFNLMTDDQRKSLAQEIRDMIHGSGGIHSVDAIESLFKQYSGAVQREAELLQFKAREDGRERLHADDQRRVDKMAGELGLLALEVAGIKEMKLQAERNVHEKLNGRGGALYTLSNNYAWKSVMPTMNEYKAQSIGNDPSGGYLVRDDVGPFFDRLRPMSVVLAAGPRLMACESDALSLPTLQATLPATNPSTTVYPTAENGDITESSAMFNKARIPMRKYAIYTVGSSEWFSDADPNPRQIIEEDHRQQLAARLDKDMLEGSGTGSTIMGLRSYGTATSLAAAGATPTLANVVDGLYRMEANNGKPGAIFMHPRTWNSLRKIVDGQSRYQLQPDPTQESRTSLFGLPVFLSSQMSIAETSSNSANTDCSYIVIADMSRMVVARRTEVVVLYDPFTYAKSDRIAIRSTTRWGMGVIDPAAVEVLTGVRP